MLVDNHERPLRYLRLAVTDRCNLRCFYCMPEEGLNFSKKSQLLSYEEMLRLTVNLCDLGIEKVRITGGEPFVRKDLIPFLAELRKIDGLKNLSITTNGTAPLETVSQLDDLGISSVNLSLDTLDPERFFQITRRNEFQQVWRYLEELMAAGIETKINTVVMKNHNLEDILPMSELVKTYNIKVRFIEEMPFNGGSKSYDDLIWNAKKIVQHIESSFGELTRLNDDESSTSYNYTFNGALGSIGVIPAFTRSICSNCDRIRLTPKGSLKTCLYDNGVFNFRDFLRSGVTDEEIRNQFLMLFQQRFKNGFEAQKNTQQNHGSLDSMATIGG